MLDDRSGAARIAAQVGARARHHPGTLDRRLLPFAPTSARRRPGRAGGGRRAAARRGQGLGSRRATSIRICRCNWRRPPPAACAPSHATLLSPFDPVVWDRERASELFGFDYTLECYTPEPKRRYGYFVLPILVGNRLVGRLDAKAHRREGVFEVKALYLEERHRLRTRRWRSSRRARDRRLRTLARDAAGDAGALPPGGVREAAEDATGRDALKYQASSKHLTLSSPWRRGPVGRCPRPSSRRKPRSICSCSSSPRRRGPSDLQAPKQRHWVPAFAGMTECPLLTRDSWQMRPPRQRRIVSYLPSATRSVMASQPVTAQCAVWSAPDCAGACGRGGRVGRPCAQE